jgi:peptide/nickel transport system permease protein
MAILVFSVKLGVLPSGGRGPVAETASAGRRLSHLVMPACVLALAYFSTWSRYIRAGLVETVNEDFIRTARAKGLAEKAVILKHALRSAVLPFVAAVSMQVSTLFTGAVITETVFAWPGMGTMFYQGIQRQDYTRIMGVVVVASLCIILFNTLGDLTCFLLDPRGRSHWEDGTRGKEPA